MSRLFPLLSTCGAEQILHIGPCESSPGSHSMSSFILKSILMRAIRGLFKHSLSLNVRVMYLSHLLKSICKSQGRSAVTLRRQVSGIFVQDLINTIC